MEDKITIQKENLLKAYNQASEEQKALLENIFGKEIFHKNITECVKTFEDACEILGDEHPLVKEYWGVVNINLDITQNLISYLKLRIIAEVLNEGWEPTLNEGECRFYPWFDLDTKEEYDNLDDSDKKYCVPLQSNGHPNTKNINGSPMYLVANVASSHSHLINGMTLTLRTRELAEYFCKQFIDIWVNFFTGK